MLTADVLAAKSFLSYIFIVIFAFLLKIIIFCFFNYKNCKTEVVVISISAANIPIADVLAVGKWKIVVDKNWLLSGS